MLNKTVLRALATAIVLITSGSATFAQELRPASRTITTLTDAEFSGGQVFTTQRPVDLTGLAVAGAPGYVPPPNACACTNLGGVTVICEDCDREVSVNLCHTHDRACQDAAQKGGIREHNTFFCTTLSD